MKQKRAFYLIQKVTDVQDLVSRLDFKGGIRGMAQGLRENNHRVLLRIQWEEITGREEYIEATLVCVPPLNHEELNIIKLAGYDIYHLNSGDYEQITKKEMVK